MKNHKTITLLLLIVIPAFLGILNCGAEDGVSGDAGTNSDRKFTLTSTAFADGGSIPLEYSCGPESDYRKPSPPLAWSGAPAGTKSHVLLFDDLHEVADGWVHWLVVDIPAATASLAKGAGGKSLPAGSKEMKNSWGERAYGGPCPPPPTGRHSYRIQLFAMPDAQTSLSFEGHNGRQISETLKSRALGVATLTGTYDRSGKE